MPKSLVVALLLAPGVPSLACVNTSYSRAEDGQLTSDATRIITGHFPEHGETFYLHQVTTQAAALQKDPGNVEARNDLAAALLKLQRFEEAENELLRIEQQQPNRYKTHANLGVLYKKTGDYRRAAAHTRKSLEIRPEGHLGLGDYYLRMLDWRARVAAGETGAAEVNFLGTRYDSGAAATAVNPLTDKKNLLTLIKADRHFASAYLVLGDVLYEEEDLQNAARSYLMARRILSSQPTGVEYVTVGERLENLRERWIEMASASPEYIFDPRYALQIEREFFDAEQWVTDYQQVEADLVEEGRKVDFALVQGEMHSRGYPDPVYTEAGFYRGKNERSPGEWAIAILIGLVSALLALLIVFCTCTWLRTRSVPAEA